MRAHVLALALASVTGACAARAAPVAPPAPPPAATEEADDGLEWGTTFVGSACVSPLDDREYAATLPGLDLALSGDPLRQRAEAAAAQVIVGKLRAATRRLEGSVRVRRVTSVTEGSGRVCATVYARQLRIRPPPPPPPPPVPPATRFRARVLSAR